MSSTASKLVAERYANALYELAQEQQSVDAVLETLLALQRGIKEHAEFQAFVANPTLSRAQSAQAMEALLAPLKPSRLVRQFFAALAANHRLTLTETVIELFAERAAKARGESRAIVETATPLSAADQQALAAALSKRAGHKVTLAMEENPDLVGGLRIRLEGVMLDYSVQGRLERLKMLLAQPVHT